jgi:HEAT repeat protein
VQDSDAKMRRASVGALAWLLPASRSILQGCLKDSDDETRDDAVRALVDYPEAWPALMPVLQAALHDPQRQDKTLQRMANAGVVAPALEVQLLEILASGQRQSRCFAATVLGNSPKPSPRVITRLVAALNDDDGEIRTAAACALSKLDRQAVQAIPILLDAAIHNYAKKRAFRMTLHVWHDDPPIALLRFGTRAVPALADRLSDPSLDDLISDEQRRRWCTQWLAAIVRESKEAILPLMQLARGNDTNAAASAKQALASLGEEGEVLVPALLELLRRDHTAPWIIREAIVQLGQIGPAAKAAVPLLREIARTRDDCREEASIAHWQITHDHELVLPVATAMLNVRYYYLSDSPVDILAEIGPAARTALPALRQLCQAREHDVQILRAIWRIEGKADTVLPYLLVPSMNGPVCELLAEMGSAAKPALPRLRAAVKYGHLRSVTAAGGAICSIEQNLDELPVLLAGLRHPDAWERLTAIRALERLGPLAQPAVPALDAATDDCELSVRVAARKALKEIRGK